MAYLNPKPRGLTLGDLAASLPEATMQAATRMSTDLVYFSPVCSLCSLHSAIFIVFSLIHQFIFKQDFLGADLCCIVT